MSAPTCSWDEGVARLIVELGARPVAELCEHGWVGEHEIGDGETCEGAQHS